MWPSSSASPERFQLTWATNSGLRHLARPSRTGASAAQPPRGCRLPITRESNGNTMAKQKAKRVDVVKQGNGWVAATSKGKAFGEAPTKQAVIDKTATKARTSARPVSVR